MFDQTEQVMPFMPSPLSRPVLHGLTSADALHGNLLAEPATRRLCGRAYRIPGNQASRADLGDPHGQLYG